MYNHKLYIEKDASGVPLEPGQFVCYNKSGSIAFGRIEKITDKEIHVHCIAPVHSGWKYPTGSFTKPNHVSRICYGHNLFVISQERLKELIGE